MTCADSHTATREPRCACCQQADQVSQIPLPRLDYPGVQFWRCDRCGYVWELRDEERPDERAMSRPRVLLS